MGTTPHPRKWKHYQRVYLEMCINKALSHTHVDKGMSRQSICFGLCCSPMFYVSLAQNENVWPALFAREPFTTLPSSPRCHLFSPSLNNSHHHQLSHHYVPLRRGSALLHLLFKTSKEVPDAGLPYRHTQEALLKPRLNPTPLCACIHSESSRTSWILCCTQTPRRQPEHCAEWCSDRDRATMSQGEMVLCFCSEIPKEKRTIGYLKVLR